MRIRKADFEVVTACNTVAPVFPMLRCSLQISKLVSVDKKKGNTVAHSCTRSADSNPHYFDILIYFLNLSKFTSFQFH